MSSKKKLAPKKTSSSSSTGLVLSNSAGRNCGQGLPDDVHGRLWELFRHIEKEFEVLHAENVALKEKLDQTNDKLEMVVNERNSALESSVSQGAVSTLAAADSHLLSSTTPLRKIKTSGTNITKKLKKTYTPSSKKGASSTKPPDCTLVCSFTGHRDGVWQVAHARNGQPLLGSASADGTSCVWDVNSGALILRYTGHNGSVNDIAFHPTECNICTASGDNTAHIWKCTVSGGGGGEKAAHLDSSGEDRLSEDEAGEVVDHQHQATSHSPLKVLAGHSGPVVACDWLCSGHQLVTGSWDHSAQLWDAETGSVVLNLAGHDRELTHICAHPMQQLVVTSSHDTTFRLWDFRAPPIHSVNVFQGHTKAVNSAVFSRTDSVISASDDHTVKIWDLHNMRCPVAAIRQDCGLNRISVSFNHNILAVPQDNRHIRLYDLNGHRLAHLPHRNAGHVKMVHSVCWSQNTHPQRSNLFSSAFDRSVIGWKVTF